ncbi:hypothetical protein DMH04_41215 [Kibdelosporangium aridum]|uniref:Uncharacterized protein n=1 Tax=Kibdelosporangium aridum TaxID=2030 RepID=A0A428YUQ6_KIBAR|nr:hypothetical protein [Kibdelosporangium aridum]RSM73434.1 hypothetical protein DMH04_41215 [Kibdelosporangium aridum]
MRISVLSKEYLLISVTASEDVTSDPVAFAFAAPSVDPSVWTSGDWVGTQARILVGPGGAVTLTKGTWDVWLKITDSPEIPVRKVDQLVVY